MYAMEGEGSEDIIDAPSNVHSSPPEWGVGKTMTSELTMFSLRGVFVSFEECVFAWCHVSADRFPGSLLREEILREALP